MDPLNRLKRRLSKRSFPRAYEHSAHSYEDDESDTAYVHFCGVCFHLSCMHALTYIIQHYDRNRARLRFPPSSCQRAGTNLRPCTRRYTDPRMRHKELHPPSQVSLSRTKTSLRDLLSPPETAFSPTNDLPPNPCRDKAPAVCTK